MGNYFFFYFFRNINLFKIPQKVKETLEQNILNIKNQINEAEKLKEDAKNILIEHEKKISNSKNEVKEMIDKASEEAEKNVIRVNKEFHNLMENRKKMLKRELDNLKIKLKKILKMHQLK